MMPEEKIKTDIVDATKTEVVIARIPNELAWTLALSPLGFLFLFWTMHNVVLFIAIELIVNCILSIADYIRIRRAGYTSLNVFWLFAGLLTAAPVYLFARSKLLRQPYTIPIVWVVTFVIYLGLSGTTGNLNVQNPSPTTNTSTPQSTINTPTFFKPFVFNTSDLDVTSNKNMEIAFTKTFALASNSENTSSGAEQISMEELTKSPYLYLGKLIELTGMVYSIRQLPPTTSMQGGDWYEILLSASNGNSPSLKTTIDLVYEGNASYIGNNTTLTCSGYFIGSAEGKNSFGGPVEEMVLVGNSCIPYQQSHYGISSNTTINNESGIPVPYSNNSVDINSQKQPTMPIQDHGQITLNQVKNFYKASPYFIKFESGALQEDQWTLMGSATVNGDDITVYTKGDNYNALLGVELFINRTDFDKETIKYLKDFVSATDPDLPDGEKLINDMINEAKNSEYAEYSERTTNGKTFSLALAAYPKSIVFTISDNNL